MNQLNLSVNRGAELGTGVVAEIFGGLGVLTLARLYQLSAAGIELPKHVAAGGAGEYPEVAVVATGVALLAGAVLAGLFYLDTRRARVGVVPR